MSSPLIDSCQDNETPPSTPERHVIVERLRAILSRRRARKAQETAAKLKRDRLAKRVAISAAITGIPLEQAGQVRDTLDPPSPTSVESGPIKRRRLSLSDWDEDPQLIDFAYPPAPYLPPFEIFSLTNSTNNGSDNGLLSLPSFPWSPLYNHGNKPLDTDTLNFIHRYYCRECRMEEARRKATGSRASSASSAGDQGGGAGAEQGSGDQPISPQAALDEASLQQAMDMNKESLKRKLLMRRSIPELVDQGIYPSPKTPAAYAEQRMKLERAKNNQTNKNSHGIHQQNRKIGDSLRHKLEHRPERASLVEHHILEDSTADPSIQEKQRLLKRARLQDSLSGRLALRPGPLELVERNIISEPELQHAVKDGVLQFPKTHMDMDESSLGPSFMDSSDDNASVFGGASVAGSNRSEGLPSPSGIGGGAESTTSSKSSLRSVPSPPDITPLLSKLDGDGKFSFTHGAITSQSFAFSGCSSQPSGTVSKSSSSSSLSSMSGSRVKKKGKSAPSKSRVIKFHEYKGPPSVAKSTSASPIPSVTSASIMSPPPPRASTPGAVPGTGGDGYNAILQQQKLLLQWQLEVQKNVGGPCIHHRQMTSFASTELCSPNHNYVMAPSPSSSVTSIASPGSMSSGIVTPQPVLTPQPLVCVTPQPSVTPQPTRILTPLTQSPAPAPSPVPPALIFPVAAASPIPPAPPPPPLLSAQPKKQAHPTITSRVLTIPRSIPVVMATPNSQAASLAALSALPGVAAFGAAGLGNAASGPVTTSLTFPAGMVGSVANAITSGANAVGAVGSISTFPATAVTPVAHSHVPSEQRSQSNPPANPTAAALINTNPTLTLNTTPAPIVNHPNNPPKITKLEDLKVADLKAECKKRNLPVSGPKPNLLNKLAAYTDEIVAEHQARLAAMPPQTATSAPKTSRTSSASSVTMKSPPNSAGVKSAFTAPFSNEDVSMMPISPPVSPCNGTGVMDLNASMASVMSQPLSPPDDSNMEVQAPTSGHADMTSSASANQMVATSLLVHNGQAKASMVNGTPMMIDPQSRPPSVTPMDVDSSANVAMQSNELTTINENGSLAYSASFPAAAGLNDNAHITHAASLANVSMGTSNTTTAITGLKVSPAQIVTTSGLPNGRIGALTLAKPLLANGAKPLQIQLTPLSHPNKPTTAILKQVPVSGQNLTQIQIPVSQVANQPIKVPVQVPTVTQAKVHIPAVPVSGQLAVPVSGALPMSAEVSIPVSGGTITIPVSQLPPHLQAQVQQQIQQQIQQQQAKQAANNNNTSDTTVKTTTGVIRAANTSAKVTTPVTSTSKGGKNSANKLKAPTKPRGKGKNARNNAKSITNSTVTQTVLNAALGQPQTTQLIIKNEPDAVKQEKMSSPVQKVSTTTPTLINPFSTDKVKTETPQQMVTSSTTSPTQDMTTEDLLRQQQRQIEELKSQLVDTRSKLDDADKQKLIHQEQLRKLAIAKIATITQQNQLNALLAEQARTQKQIQALAQAHNAQLSQLTKQSMELSNQTSAAKGSASTSRTTSPTSLLNIANLTSSASTATSVTETRPPTTTQNLTSLLQTQGLQNINLSQTKIVQVINANGQPQLVLTSQPTSSKTTLSLTSAASSLGSPPSLISKTSQSVPSSPAASIKVPRSSTSPQITRSPPNYDEAIKNKQKSASSSGDAGSPGLSAMDDVLEILIRSGELPPSAAQEPPPTPGLQATSAATTKVTKGVNVGSPSSMMTSPTHSPLVGTTISIPASSPFSVGTVSGATQLLLPSMFTSQAMTSFGTSTTTSLTSPTTMVHSSGNPALVTTMVPSPCSSTSSSSQRKDLPPMARMADTGSVATVSSPGDNPMDLADTLSNALNDLPLLDMEWTSGELGEHFLNSPGGPAGVGTIMHDVDSKKDINLFTPPLSSENINQPLLFSPTQLKLGTVGQVGDNMGSLGDNLTMGDTGVTMEVNDWLEAMMPAGVVGAPNTPASTGDPILTPKPQDILDLFNMDEADLYMPTDAGIHHFEKALDSSSK